MQKTLNAVTTLVAGLIVVGGILVDAAYRYNGGGRSALFFWAFACFIVAVVVALAYFGLHPLFVLLNAGRLRFIANQRPRTPALRTVYGAPSLVSGAFQLLSAFYGPNDPSELTSQDPTPVDVTTYVAAHLAGGRLSMKVTNENLGGDPCPTILSA